MATKETTRQENNIPLCRDCCKPYFWDKQDYGDGCGGLFVRIQKGYFNMRITSPDEVVGKMVCDKEVEVIYLCVDCFDKLNIK